LVGVGVDARGAPSSGREPAIRGSTRNFYLSIWLLGHHWMVDGHGAAF